MHAMNEAPKVPKTAIELGSESLLRMTVSAAARRYGVSGSVVGKRLRPADRRETAQLSLAMA
jgi:hypothetical protein